MTFVPARRIHFCGFNAFKRDILSRRIVRVMRMVGGIFCRWKRLKKSAALLFPEFDLFEKKVDVDVIFGGETLDAVESRRIASQQLLVKSDFVTFCDFLSANVTLFGFDLGHLSLLLIENRATFASSAGNISEVDAPRQGGQGDSS